MGPDDITVSTSLMDLYRSRSTATPADTRRRCSAGRTRSAVAKQQQKQKPAAPETDDALTRLGKVKHSLLGECVRVRLRSWEGPNYVGQKGRYVFIECLVPRDQGKWGAGKLIQAYDDGGKPVATIASSVSYIDDLRRYGSFRWARSEPALTNSEAMISLP
jgi:hypothetical protein